MVLRVKVQIINWIGKAVSRCRTRGLRTVTAIGTPFLIGLIIFQLVIPANFVRAADGDLEPNSDSQDTGITLSESPVIATPLLDAVMEQTNAGGTDPVRATEEDIDVTHLANQTVTIIANGQSYPVSSEHYGQNEPSIPAGLLERTLQVKQLANGSGISISYAGAKYIHNFPIPNVGRYLGCDWDQDILVLLFEGNVRKTIVMPTLRELLFKRPVSLFTPIQPPLNPDLPPATNIRLARLRPDNFDYSSRGRLAVPDRSELAARRLVGVVDRKLLQQFAQTVEQVRYVPLHSSLQGKGIWDSITHGDVMLTNGEGANEVIIQGSNRDAENEAVELQAGAVINQAQLFTRNYVERMGGMLDALRSERSKFDRWMRDPQVLNSLFGEGVVDAHRNVPKDILLKMINHAQEMKKTNAHRAQYTLAQAAEQSDYYQRLYDRASHSVENVGFVPPAVRQIFFEMGEMRSQLDLGELNARLAKVIKWTAWGTSIAAAGLAADQGFTGGAGRQLAMEMISFAQKELLYYMPIYSDWNYVKLLWTHSIPGQLIIPTAIVAGFMMVRPLTQQASTLTLLMQTGIRSFAYLQINPLRLLARATGQIARFQAAKEGELVPNVVGPDSISEQSMVANHPGRNDLWNEQIRIEHLRSVLVDAAAISVAAQTTHTDPGLLWSLSRNMHVDSDMDVNQALEVRDLILRELGPLTAEQWRLVINQVGPKAFVELVEAYKQKAAHLITNNVRLNWFQKTRQHMELMVKFRMIKKVAEYSEATFLELRDASPTDRVGTMTARHVGVDQGVSLIVAANFGAMAGDNLLDRHAQADQFLWTNSTATTEMVQQLGIGYTRGAATENELFNNRNLATNSAHVPLLDFEAKQVVGRLPLMRELASMVKTVFNVRKTQPGEIAFKTMRTGRVKFAQATFAIGFLPWLLAPVFMKDGGLHKLIEGVTWEKAAYIQCMFMARAMWAFGWPRLFIGPAINAHESDIEDRFTEHQKLRALLQQSCRLGSEAEAEKYLALYLDHNASRGNLETPDPPQRFSEESAVSFGQRLIDFDLEHPRFIMKGSQAVMIGTELFYGAVSTAMAMYMYLQNAHQAAAKMLWFAVNWHDWNIVSHIPEGDGALGVGMKSAIYTYALFGGQKLFNWGYDFQKLKRLEAKSRSLSRQFALLESKIDHLRHVELPAVAREINVEFATRPLTGNIEPSLRPFQRQQELIRQKTNFEEDKRGIEAELEILELQIEETKQALAGSVNALWNFPLVGLAGGIAKRAVAVTNRLTAEVGIRYLRFSYSRTQRELARVQKELSALPARAESSEHRAYLTSTIGTLYGDLNEIATARDEKILALQRSQLEGRQDTLTAKLQQMEKERDERITAFQRARAQLRAKPGSKVIQSAGTAIRNCASWVISKVKPSEVLPPQAQLE